VKPSHLERPHRDDPWRPPDVEESTRRAAGCRAPPDPDAIGGPEVLRRGTSRLGRVRSPPDQATGGPPCGRAPLLADGVDPRAHLLSSFPATLSPDGRWYSRPLTALEKHRYSRYV